MSLTLAPPMWDSNTKHTPCTPNEVPLVEAGKEHCVQIRFRNLCVSSGLVGWPDGVVFLTDSVVSIAEV